MIAGSISLMSLEHGKKMIFSILHEIKVSLFAKKTSLQKVSGLVNIWV